ncbi:peptidoglycan bridge formation glycyltransferase FemA/FemB family protein [Patescibacteria group bacterium]|nr:peptidoglycan bridge formation glycyltransferase FemA/FemB family protein [Patescibacteria group bacterium]MBU4580046.1 peptidoglycan bridge formation glycyltransferase FemA/FemB family protein [Patescibacteria group bacterium]
MLFRSATKEEENVWNELIIANPDGGHFLQSFQWGEFKAKWEWKPQRFILEENNGKKLAIQILKRKTLLGWIWYCPKGPNLSSFSSSQWPRILKSLKETARKNNVLLIKIEPEVIENQEEIKKYESFGLLKSRLDLQFKATTFVDLKKTEEEILAGFKQKTRYNIRLAQKHGIIVEENSSQEGIQIMYDLYEETSTRANFSMRPKEYILSYWKKCIETNCGKIFIASLNGNPLAALFTYRLGKKIWYKDGGSSGNSKKTMSPYALQWSVMQWAKKNGLETYDMVAVPPKSERSEKSPWWGLYKFKSGFNPNITEFVGCLDLPIKKHSYSIWREIELKYLQIYKKIYKNAFY